jgi:hypothetical protein
VYPATPSSARRSPTTHPEHDHLRTWAGPWTDTLDRAATDALVRATVGQFPGSVRLPLDLFDLLDGGVKLTPGGRLPRSLVRAVQAERPSWYPLDRPASIEEDLPPLATRTTYSAPLGSCGSTAGSSLPPRRPAMICRSSADSATPWKPDSFHDVLLGVASGYPAARGPTTTEHLAEAVLP